ncbi:uncharacterized protein [Panulirus ornatus]|uniref:uncharacterized protein n=1 Tax=Panulirus ornatus TaxID=150431 RepID=UPI003A85B4DE
MSACSTGSLGSIVSASSVGSDHLILHEQRVLQHPYEGSWSYSILMRAVDPARAAGPAELPDSSLEDLGKPSAMTLDISTSFGRGKSNRAMPVVKENNWVNTFGMFPARRTLRQSVTIYIGWVAVHTLDTVHPSSSSEESRAQGLLNGIKMKAILSALCVLVLSFLTTAIPEASQDEKTFWNISWPDLDHDHGHNCSIGGIFSIPEDMCKGFHVCGFNFTTKAMEHQFISCDEGKIFNTTSCVPEDEYICPHY